MSTPFIAEKDKADWAADSKKWRGKELTGTFSHWCLDWDFLPIDETCPEWPCACAKELQEEAANV